MRAIWLGVGVSMGPTPETCAWRRAALQQVTGAIAKEAQARVADLLQDLLEMARRRRTMKSGAASLFRGGWGSDGVP